MGKPDLLLYEKTECRRNPVRGQALVLRVWPMRLGEQLGLLTRNKNFNRQMLADKAIFATWRTNRVGQVYRCIVSPV